SFSRITTSHQAPALSVPQLARLHAVAVAQPPDLFTGRRLARRLRAAIRRVEGFPVRQRLRLRSSANNQAGKLADDGCPCCAVIAHGRADADQTHGSAVSRENWRTGHARL